MVGYAILVVGAASSRDHSMIAISQLFFAAESRSHEKSSYFGVVSCERFNFRVFRGFGGYNHFGMDSF